MGPILEQLELNSTFFLQFAVFVVLYFVLSAVYFKPFLKLIEHRRKKTIGDLEEAERILARANAKLNEYQQKITSDRLRTREEFDRLIAEAKKEETLILSHARDEARKITQQTQENLAKQKAQMKSELSAEVEGLAQMISEKLLSRKV